jgi:hypothetical protein
VRKSDPKAVSLVLPIGNGIAWRPNAREESRCVESQTIPAAKKVCDADFIRMRKEPLAMGNANGFHAPFGLPSSINNTRVIEHALCHEEGGFARQHRTDGECRTLL